MTQQEMQLIRRTAWMNIQLEDNPSLRPEKKARPRRPHQGDVYARLHRSNRYGVVRPGG
jgi:hypothetical protein